MNGKGTQYRNMTRRTALSGFAAGAACAQVPTSLAASTAVPLHKDVAQKVRDLVVGKPTALRVLAPRGSGANVTPIIRAFERMTGVEVYLKQAGVEEINAILSLDAMSGSSTYDIALPATYGMADLVSANAILPISDYAEKYEPRNFRDDILYTAGDSVNGDLYGFQTDGDVYMMFYQKSLLENSDEAARYADQYGRPLAIADTWDELDRQMAYFNRPDDGLWGGLLFRTPGYLAWEWWMRLHAKGVWPFATDMTPQIASDAGVSALEDMIKATEALHPSTRRLDLFENWERFKKGDVFCNIGWGGSQKSFNAPDSAIRDNLRFGPTPGGAVDGSVLTIPYFNWGWNYVVLRNSHIPEIAYLFSLFASSPDMTTLAVRQADGFFDPFRAEHYDDAAIKAAYTPEFLDVHRKGMRHAMPDLYLDRQGAYRRALSEQLNRVLDGEISPKAALRQVAQRWNLITYSVGQTVQQEKWRQLRLKYPAHLRARLQDIK